MAVSGEGLYFLLQNAQRLKKNKQKKDLSLLWQFLKSLSSKELDKKLPLHSPQPERSHYKVVFESRAVNVGDRQWVGGKRIEKREQNDFDFWNMPLSVGTSDHSSMCLYLRYHKNSSHTVNMTYSDKNLWLNDYSDKNWKDLTVPFHLI